MSRDAEHVEQSLLFQWAGIMGGRLPEVQMLFAIPNGGHRHIAVAAKLKAEGVRAGVPDLCLPVPRGEYHALYIELKAKGGRATPSQQGWISALREHGNHAVVCVGWDAAREEIVRYLRLPKPCQR